MKPEAELTHLIERANALPHDQRERLIQCLDSRDEVEREQIGFGQVLGSFQLKELIGEGGMGSVYLATHVDVPDLQAAVKTIRTDSRDREFIQRFERERAIIAKMDHPNIARIMDGGTTAGGMPWFAMEYLDGEPLDQWCDQRKADIQQRLKLFLLVCDAVIHAHANLVIHRDLKPGNIMVNDKGEVKLLDFGLAGALTEEQGVGKTVGIGAALMTPEYASPEQIRGDLLGVRSDVYSLGVILNELLCGRRPSWFKDRSPMAIYQGVCEREPELMSRVLTRATTRTGPDTDPQTICESRSLGPKRLKRLLKGDLQSIVSKALEKNPARRYQTVQEMAGDIRAYMEGRTVGARPQTSGYRARKFLWRYRVACGTTALFILMISAFALTTFQQKQQVVQERDLAQLERDRARKITAFLSEVLEYANPDRHQGRRITVHEALDQSMVMLEDQFQDQPENRAQILWSMGRVYRRLNEFKKAEPLLDEAMQLFQASGSGGDDLPELVSMRGYVAYYNGDQDKSLKYVAEGADLAEQRWGADDCRSMRLRGFHLGLLPFLGETDKGLELFAQLVPRAKDLCPDQILLADILHAYGITKYYSEDFQTAFELHQEAYGIYERAGEIKVKQLTVLETLAFLADHLGHVSARSWREHLIEVSLKLLGPNHFRTLTNRVPLLMDQHERGELALEELIERLAEYRKILAANENVNPPKLAQFSSYLHPLYLKAGQVDKAVDLARETLASLGPNEQMAYYFLLNLVDALAIKGDRPTWERLLDKAQRHPQAANRQKLLLYTQVTALYLQGDYPMAGEKAGDLLEHRESLSSDQIMDLKGIMAVSLNRMGKIDEGRIYYEAVRNFKNPYSLLDYAALHEMYR